MKRFSLSIKSALVLHKWSIWLVCRMCHSYEHVFYTGGNRYDMYVEMGLFLFSFVVTLVTIKIRLQCYIEHVQCTMYTIMNSNKHIN